MPRTCPRSGQPATPSPAPPSRLPARRPRWPPCPHPVTCWRRRPGRWPATGHYAPASTRRDTAQRQARHRRPSRRRGRQMRAGNTGRLGRRTIYAMVLPGLAGGGPGSPVAMPARNAESTHSDRRETYMPVLSVRRAAMTAVTTAALAGFSLTPAAAAGYPGTAKPQASTTTTGTIRSQFGFDSAHTGDNPSETILGPGNVAGLQLKWGFLSDSPNVDHSAAVANGVVYFPGLSHLYAVSAATGTQLWSFALNNAFFSDPAVVNGIVYTGSVNGNVYAFD